jgi:glutamyl-tRNA synthetase
MIELFSLDRMSRVNAKFDRDKLLAFNTDAVAAASEDRLLETFNDWLSVNLDSPISRAGLDEAVKRTLLQVNRGFRTFPDIDAKSGFLFVADDAIAYDPKAVNKVLAKDDGAGYAMLETLLPQLEAAEPWTHEVLERVITQACESQNVGMGKVAQPIRVAVSGTTVSPAIYDTLVLLGKTRTLSRIRRVLADRS